MLRPSVVSVILKGSSRGNVPLRASGNLFIRLTSGHVYAASTIGQNHLAERPMNLGLLVFAAICTIVLLYCLFRSADEWRMVLTFFLMTYAAGLAAPHGRGMGLGVWPSLTAYPEARYWYLPSLAVVWSITGVLTLEGTRLFSRSGCSWYW
jgi:hypothetical protein